MILSVQKQADVKFNFLSYLLQWQRRSDNPEALCQTCPKVQQ